MVAATGRWGRIAGGALALALGAALVAGCGDDGPGSQVLGQLDTPGTPNGDAVVPDDDASGPDGVAPDGALPDAGPEAVCGDGACDAGEDVFSCRDDCPAPPALVCLATGCKDALDACLDLPECTDALACALACEPDAEGCADACREGLSGAVQFVAGQLAACAEAEGCLAGGGGADPASCEGRCDDFVEGAPCQCDETCAVFDDCCDDYEDLCLGGGGPTCVEEACGSQLAACQAAPGCLDGLACVAACGGQACVQQCVGQVPQGSRPALQALAQCAAAECGDGCGNGACDPGETAETCPADCAEGPACGDGACQKGESAESCPEDCAEGPACGDGVCEVPENPLTCPADCGGSGPVCGDGACQMGEGFLDCPEDCAPPGSCGDGVCNGPETAQSCPEDCGGGGGGDDLVACLTAECPAELAACLADAECQGALTCIGQCAAGDFGCLIGCASLNQAVIGIALCGQPAGCFDGGGGGGGGSCGDGQCAGGENAFTCPQDCGGGGGSCGDGQCAGGENAFTCPQDCGGGGGSCGDGVCDPTESAATCPQDCGGGGGGDPVACIQAECSDEYAACLADPGCVPVIECALDCDPSDQDCLLGCAQEGGFNGAAIGLGICVSQSGCLDGGGGGGPVCGDGQCSGGENGFTCPQDCGGGGGPTCGDGQCGFFESPQTCPEDCGGGGGGDGLLACLEEGCPQQLAACEATPSCAAAIPCLEACVDSGGTGCTNQCAAQFGQSQQLQALGQCGFQAGCGNPTP